MNKEIIIELIDVRLQKVISYHDLEYVSTVINKKDKEVTQVLKTDTNSCKLVNNSTYRCGNTIMKVERFSSFTKLTLSVQLTEKQLCLL